MNAGDGWTESHPRDLLSAVRDAIGPRPGFDRLLRLFACAAARIVWLHIPQGPCRSAVEAAEGFADGRVAADQLESARIAAERAAVSHARGRVSAGWAAASTTQPDPFTAARRALEEVLQLFPGHPQSAELHARSLAHLLADLFDPFLRCPGSVLAEPPPRIVTVRAFADDPRVRDAAVQIYQSNDFRDFHLLGTHIRSAGCTDIGILEHCRRGRHARGCWVLDALLPPAVAGRRVMGVGE